MSAAQLPSIKVAQARELFFGQGCDPAPWIAPHISRSWQRCRPVGHQATDPEPMALALLRERREQAMRLLNCAQPELDGLAEHAVGNGCVVILSDASGLILEEVGSADFLPKAERIALQPGVEWSERNRGTNAIGTALAEREALMVLGAEHYLAQNGTLGCAAAPIFTGRGELAGALDISGETVRVNTHALGLVRMAAQQVEHRMMLAEAGGHVLRFHARPALIGTAREGLMVIDGGRIVAANRVTLELFGRSWKDLLDLDADDFLGPHWPRMEHRRGLLTLPGGRQIATVMERSNTPGTARPTQRRSMQTQGSTESDDVQPLLHGHLPQLAARSPDAHKGRFGHLLVIGGDRGFGGAALLSAESALRSGAGMVSLATRLEHVPAALARLPEVMTVGVASANQLMGLLEKISVIVIGPGLGDASWGKSLLSVAANASQPQVWDADALNQLATGSVSLPANCVITPHPGEAARLLGLSTAEVQANRLKVARALSQKFNAVAILKGAGSLIASPDGRVSRCDQGHPAMATAGLGDVLAGLVGALLAQGMPAYEASCLAVWLHATAGDRQGTFGRGLAASDLIPAIRQLLEEQSPCLK